MLKLLAGATFALAILAGPLTVSAGDYETSAEAIKKAKPYPLKTCIVSDEKLDGDMGKPFVFVHDGQEYKLCCKGCLKDFKKEPTKFVKKLADAQKATKGGAKPAAKAQATAAE